MSSDGPTDQDEDPETYWKGRAAQIVTAMSDALAVRGWEFAVISIGRVERTPKGGFICPGASILRIESGIAPALPAEARNLRRLADDVDECFAAAGVQEATDSHTEELETPRMRRPL